MIMKFCSLIITVWTVNVKEMIFFIFNLCLNTNISAGRSTNFCFILQSKPLCNKIATPLALLLPRASSTGAPHSAFHCFSLSRVECVSWRKIIFAFCFLHHANNERRLLKLREPLTFKDNIMKSQLRTNRNSSSVIIWRVSSLCKAANNWHNRCKG